MIARTPAPSALIPALLVLLWTTPCIAQTTIRVPGNEGTIQAGINAAHNGDTVLVAPGTYNENIDFKGKAITVTSGAKSYADAASTILYGAKDGPVVTFNSNEPATAVLNGFTIQNGHADAASGLADGGIQISQSSPTINNNILSSNFGCGIAISNNASPLIQGNYITQTRGETEKSPKPCGIGNGIVMVNGGNVQVIGNTIENNILLQSETDEDTCGAGIDIFSGADVLIKNNTIRNNQSQCAPGIEVAPVAPSHLSLIQNLFYGNIGSNVGGNLQIVILGNQEPPYPSLTEINNTIYGLGEELVSTFGPSNIANNIFINTVTDPDFNYWNALSCAGAGSLLNLSHNDIYNVLQPASGSTGCNLDEGSLSVDPQFLNPANGNFHTPPASPVVAAGDIGAPAIPSADLDNKARVVCKTIDMGVYEVRPHPPISLASSNNPAPGGSSLTFTTHLTGNCNIPTGTVTFLDGSNPIGTAVLDESGSATLTTSFLVVGTHNITASYPGDFNFESNTSAILVQIITGDPTATSLTVSPNPAIVFSPIVFTARVTSPYGTPTGAVNFIAAGATIATAELDTNGKGTATVSTLGAGQYNITASYTADTRFQPSSSVPVAETVTAIGSITTLSTTPNPGAAGQIVMFTAVVKAVQSSVTPSGTITLMDGAATLGASPLDTNGEVTFRISTLSLGSHTLTAHYGGSANFNPSNGALVEAITLIGTETTLTASPNPANQGQAVTLTASTASALAGTTPTGVVTFLDGAAVLGSSPLNASGTASLTTSSLTLGTHRLTATLASGAVFSGSTSPVVNETIQSYDFTIIPSQTSVSLPSGDWTVLQVKLTPIGGFHGSVSLACSGVPDHSQCLFQQGFVVSLAAGVQTVPLAINTSDVFGYGHETASANGGATARFGKDGKFLAFLIIPVLGLLRRVRSASKLLRSVSLLLGGILLLLGMQACSGKLPAKAAPGTYKLSIGATDTAATLSHSVDLELTITP